MQDLATAMTPGPTRTHTASASGTIEAIPIPRDPNTMTSQTAPTKIPSAFHQIPDEIHVQIMSYHLSRDPVSQICWGLTSRRFYQILQSVLNPRIFCASKNKYIDSEPQISDLRMQVSLDEENVLYGWYEYGYMFEAPRSTWQSSLFERLKDEKWLWGDLRFCAWCVRYKPPKAFRGFELEHEVLGSGEDVLKCLGLDLLRRETGTDWEEEVRYEDICTRCRARLLLVRWRGRSEVRDVRRNFGEERRSLGLVRPAMEGRAGVLERGVEELGWCDPEILEAWNEVFAKISL
ncbi:hypothetical protein VTL71DRAFT_12849 [Oculimacula yallundae]|uniref:F-box domain-containing protein n=1 Tax=Oculimacula yallundae TaxID=86028 RepID=A0ABR4CRC0_9HELO